MKTILKLAILLLTTISYTCIPQALQAQEVNSSQNDTSFIEDSGVLIPIQDTNGFLWGLKDTITGKLVLPYKYHHIRPFVEGRAVVSLNGLSGYINAQGKEIVSPDEHSGFEIAANFNNGYAVVKRSWNDNSYNLINYDGKLLFRPHYGYGGSPYYKVDTDRRNMSILRQRVIAHTKEGMRLLDFEGNFVSPPVNYMRLFPNGLCAVRLTKQGKLGFWDWNGNEIHPMVFDGIMTGYYMGEFNEGIAIVSKNGKWGCINESGKEIFYTDYDKIESFHNGLARVSKKLDKDNYKTGYINKLGEEVIPLNYTSDRGFFVEGFAPVIPIDSAKSRLICLGFIDTTGKPITPFKYSQVEYFKNGVARVHVRNHYGFINYEGKEIVPVIYDSQGIHGPYPLGTINDTYIFAKRDTIFDFIDLKGEVIATYNYGYMEPFFTKGKYLSFVSGGKCGLIDFVSGQIIVPIEYDYWRYLLYENTFVFVKITESGEQFHFFDINGKILEPRPYTEVDTDLEQFYNRGVAKVMNKEKYGLINRSTRLVVPCIYDNIDDFKGGMAVVEENGKYGFIDYSGKLVIPIIYDKVYPFKIGGYSTEVVKDGETFEIDKTGKMIEYDY